MSEPVGIELPETCPSCGAPARGGPIEGFCGACGADLSPRPAPPGLLARLATSIDLRSRRTRLALLGVAAVVVLLFGVLGLSFLLPSGGAGKLLLADAGRVVVVDADGSNAREIAHLASFPAWSPDGKWIAYLEGGTILSRLVVVDASGEQRRVVVTAGTDVPDSRLTPATPKWSGDSEWLAFTTWDGERLLAGYAARRDGSARTSTASTDFGWAPKDHRLATVTRNGGIDVFDVATKSRTAIVSGGASSPVWSPDGQYVAFLSREGDASRAAVVGADGSGRVVLPPTAVSDVRWSPDSKRVAVAVDQGGYSAAIAVNRDGNGMRVVCGSDVMLAWSLDSATIACRGGSIVGADAGTKKTLGAGGASVAGWSRDGSRLAMAGDGGVTIFDADGSNPRKLDSSLPHEVLAWQP